MKTKIAVVLILIVGAATILQRHFTILTLREQNRSLLKKGSEVANLSNENLELKKRLVDSNEISAFRAERGSLMKLRSEASELRRSGAKSPQELAQEIRMANEQAETEQKKAALLESQENARLLSEKVMSSIGGLNSVLFQTAKTKGEFPFSIEQAAQWAESTRFAQYFTLMMTNPPAETIGLGAFEILPRTQSIKFSAETPALYLRERTPRPQPDGGFKRAYAYSDRKTVEIALPEGNYESWESEHLTKKP
jgi:hypothetical protein